MNNENLFLTVLEATKPRIKALAYLVSGEVLAGYPLAAFSHDRRVREISGVSFLGVHIFLRISPHDQRLTSSYHHIGC